MSLSILIISYFLFTFFFAYFLRKFDSCDSYHLAIDKYANVEDPETVIAHDETSAAEFDL